MSLTELQIVSKVLNNGIEIGNARLGSTKASVDYRRKRS